VGQKFGKLLVTKLLVSKQYGTQKKRVWECICDCGNITNVVTGQLTKGATKSCGCLHKITSVENSLKSRHKIVKKDAALNCIYTQYKGNAKARKYEFNLTKEQFNLLIKSNCFYCGTEPLNLFDKRYYNLFYNGIDRINNTIGYTFENSISCCKMCNIAKNNNTLEYFMQWIKKVYKHNFEK
jgi:hypothetical protein